MPSTLLAVAYTLMLGGFGLAAALQGNGTAMMRAAAGMVMLFVSYFVLSIAVRGELGAGDVKLAGLLGLALGWTSWSALIVGTVIGLLYGAIFGAVLIAMRKATRRTSIPFGPAMLAGTFTTVIAGLGS